MILENRHLYPMTEESAIELLSCLPREVVRYLAKTIASVAISRADAIMEVVDGLSANKSRCDPQTDTIVETEELE